MRGAPLAGALLLAGCMAAQASTWRLCEKPSQLGAAQHAQRLQLAAELRRELEASGATVALVARSGVDLRRFGVQHSHAGVALADSPHTRWAVRQLYYACDEARPRLYDQGLAGFLLSADDQPGAQVSLLLLPPEAARALQAAALDTPAALQLLAARYSANAHAFSTRYQNCNQWLAELLAVALGALGGQATREQAQHWLQSQGYEPQVFEGHPLLFAASHFVPLLHHDDHPAADLEAGRFRVSLPQAIEAFVQRRLPGTRRITLCQDDRHIVVRHGGAPLGADCEPAAGDRVRPLRPLRP